MLNALEAMKVSDSSLQLQSRWCLHHQQLVQARICRLDNRKWRIKNVHLFQIWDKKLILFPLKLFQDGLSKMKYKNALSRRYITFYGTLQTGHTNNQLIKERPFFLPKLGKQTGLIFLILSWHPFPCLIKVFQLFKNIRAGKIYGLSQLCSVLKKNNFCKFYQLCLSADLKRE